MTPILPYGPPSKQVCLLFDSPDVRLVQTGERAQGGAGGHGAQLS